MNAISLEQVRIASPCTARWEDMMPVGDGTARHCGQCGLNVHDLSAMTREEAETLVGGASTSNGGRMCVRLYKRADGRVMTRDCPVGLRAARAAMMRMAGRAMAAVVFTGGALAGANGRGEGSGRIGRLKPFATIRAWLGRPDPLLRGITGVMCINPRPVNDGLVAEVKALREQEMNQRAAAAAGEPEP